MCEAQLAAFLLSAWEANFINALLICKWQRELAVKEEKKEKRRKRMKSKWSQTKINGKNRRKERKVGSNSNRNSGDQNRSPEFLSSDLTHWAKVTLKHTAKKLRTAECSGDRQNECVECYCTKVHPVCWPAPSAVDWHQPTHTPKFSL